MAQLAVQFGTQMPFAPAARLLSLACGTPVTHDTVRRLTERAGAVWWQLELDLVSALEAAALDPRAAPVAVPDQQRLRPERMVQVSVDGALAPLVGGEWAEVRTLVVGEVAETPHGPKATALSYVSELATAADFSRAVLGELTRRGVASHPGPIVAITDGAVRILDIMHAIEYLTDAAKAAFWIRDGRDERVARRPAARAAARRCRAGPGGIGRPATRRHAGHGDPLSVGAAINAGLCPVRRGRLAGRERRSREREQAGR